MDEAKRNDALLNGQIQVLEMVAMGAPLADILMESLKICEAQSAEMLCSIVLIEPDGIHLKHGAAPSLPPEYMRAIDGASIGPKAGSCGTAAFLGRPVIVEDIATDPLWEGYKHLALAHGLRACWSTPILDGKRKVLGTFAMYYRTPCRPTEHHFRLIEIITHLTSIAISRRKSEEERRQIFERISDAFVALDLNWRYTYVNEKAGQHFGRDPESLIGKHIWTEFPELVGLRFQTAYEKAMKEQQPVILDGYYPPLDLWFENRIYPSPEGLTIYFHNITERKRSEEQIRQSEKMTAIGQLAGGIAHDFNNQLSVMMGYAEMLNNRVSDPELNRFAGAIILAAKRSGDLTRNLLTFSRQSHVEMVPLDFHDLIREILELLGHSIDKRVVIGQNLAAHSTTILGDPAQLQNALLNLALNARDAMPDGGFLNFNTDIVDSAYLHMSISDSGSGMSEETKKRIFEPFFTTKPVGKGTGMGLASVFGTVKIHHGRIHVDSKIGSGTTFHIYLPLSTLPLDTTDDFATVKPLPKALCILLVDDDNQVGNLVADMLRGDGHTVLKSEGGREALALYRDGWQKVDLVILDMVMADMDGYETFQELRKINPRVKVLMSSGYSSGEKIQAFLDEGGIAFLNKPYEKAHLDKMIAFAVG